MTNPSTPLLKMWEIDLQTPIRIDAPGRDQTFVIDTQRYLIKDTKCSRV